jgi:hypothetical protein
MILIGLFLAIIFTVFTIYIVIDSILHDHKFYWILGLVPFVFIDFMLWAIVFS